MKRITRMIQAGQPFSFDGRRVSTNNQINRHSSSRLRSGRITKASNKASTNDFTTVLEITNKNLSESYKMLTSTLPEYMSHLINVARSIPTITMLVENFLNSREIPFNDPEWDLYDLTVRFYISKEGYFDEYGDRFFGEDHLWGRDVYYDFISSVSIPGWESSFDYYGVGEPTPCVQVKYKSLFAKYKKDIKQNLQYLIYCMDLVGPDYY